MLTADQHPAAPDANCHHQNDHSASTRGTHLYEYVDWSGTNCVFAALGKFSSPAGGQQPADMAFWSTGYLAYRRAGSRIP
jgi:hypothetical protein